MKTLGVKLLALLLAAALALGAASRYAGRRVEQMQAAAVDSLSQALLEARAQRSLEKARAQAEALLGPDATVQLTLGGPEREKPGVTVTSAPGGTAWDSLGLEQALNRQEEQLADLLAGSLLAGEGTDRASVRALVLELKNHYFLDGYYYTRAETDPARLARKTTVWQMESTVINSLYRLAEGVSADALARVTDLPSALNAVDLSGLSAGAETLEREYWERFGTAEEYAGEFPEIHAYILRYLAQYRAVCADLQEFWQAARETTGLLGYTALLGRMDTLYREVLGTVDTGLRLKDQTNLVYTEGIDGLVLYQRGLVYEKLAAGGLQLPAVKEEP